MKLTLIRKASLANCTIGDLAIDGVQECYTLEDQVREIAGAPVSSWKVAGDTAIPQGTYQVIINHSQRFNRDLPLLVNVPGFVGVRIHPGNTAADTEGCILVGTKIGDQAILESRKAFAEFFDKLETALQSGELCHIEIRNA